MTIDVILGSIIIGLVTGALTSWGITIYFRHRDKKLSRQQQFYFNKHAYLEFLRSLAYECQYQLHSLIRNEKIDAANINRIISTKPILTNMLGYITKDDLEILKRVESITDSLQDKALTGFIKQLSTDEFYSINAELYSLQSSVCQIEYHDKKNDTIFKV